MYFNENKEEIKNNSFTEGDKVNKIKVIIDLEVKSLFWLFYECKGIQKINIIKCYRKNLRILVECFTDA